MEGLDAIVGGRPRLPRTENEPKHEASRSAKYQEPKSNLEFGVAADYRKVRDQTSDGSAADSGPPSHQIEPIEQNKRGNSDYDGCKGREPIGHKEGAQNGGWVAFARKRKCDRLIRGRQSRGCKERKRSPVFRLHERSPMVVMVSNVRHERRHKGCAAGFGTSARWKG